jgi:hypothetical protein
LPVSPTKAKLRSVERQIPFGLLNLAMDPTPFVVPAEVPPASVVTVPVDMTR